MKVSQILTEMAFGNVNPSKEKRLKAALTPDNIAQHYETVITVLGNFLSFADIDHLQAVINGSDRDEGAVELAIKLFAKKLAALGINVANQTKDLLYVDLVPHSTGPRRTISIYYEKGKWYTYASVDGAGWKSKTKKFDDANEAFTSFLKQIERLNASPDKW